MNKTLIALAALAAIGPAWAQSSVTAFGVLDIGASYYETVSKYQDNGVAPSTPKPDLRQSQTVLSNGGNAGGRLGFRGQEDLGGGLAASFWLEASLWGDIGTLGRNALFFDRRSTVSLSGRFGEVRLGRDYSPTFWNDGVFDPFGNAGSGSSLIVQTMGSAFPTLQLNRGFYARKANSVGYFLPASLGGFYGQVMYAFNEVVNSDALNDPAVANNARLGRYAGGRAGYANGPFDVALAYGQSTVADNYFFGSTTNVNTFNAGASYDFGPVKLFGEYSKVDVKTDFANIANFPLTPALSPPSDLDTNNFLVGLTIPVGVGQIRASYAQVKGEFSNFTRNGAVPATTPPPKAQKYAVGYVHNLSKRTALYATFAVTENEDGAAISPVSVTSADTGPGYTNTPNSSAASYRAARGYGYDVGIRHAF
ncbi:porin [Variovorax sp. OV329]|uniref:porin n=1 Tax=Variovorax sp. OV329 TaxID=1882825 RepID=UPI0008E2F08D|nr:porin [Variovorax sp. OV329]SFN43618.1 Outer membrane protein (porin) [Variovorax sp. OV329]